jgi:hypothetical protein
MIPARKTSDAYAPSNRLKASTADTADPDDKSRYCFWIRVDEERMKVIAADEETGRAISIRRIALMDNEADGDSDD